MELVTWSRMMTRCAAILWNLLLKKHSKNRTKIQLRGGDSKFPTQWRVKLRAEETLGGGGHDSRAELMS